MITPLDIRRRTKEVKNNDVLAAIIYGRASTDQQGASIPQQEAVCRVRLEQIAASQGKGLEIRYVFSDEGISGDDRDRPGLRQLLSTIATSGIDIVCVYEVSRLARDIGHAMELLPIITNRGCSLITKDAAFFADPITGRVDMNQIMLYVLQSLMAQNETVLINDRMERGRRDLAREGKQPIRKAPFGYFLPTKADTIRNPQQFPPGSEGVYRINPAQAPYIREMFERVAAGQSLRSVCTWLQDEAKLPAPGNKSSITRHPTSSNNGKAWYMSTVRKYITDPLYKGEASYGNLKRRKDPERKKYGLKQIYFVPADPTTIIRWDSPAIVSPELWQTANDRLQVNRQMLAGPTGRKYLLSSFLRCHECGASCSGIPGGHTGKERYYFCNRSAVSPSRPKETPRLCCAGRIRGTVIETSTSAALLAAWQDESLLAESLKTFQQDLALHVASASDTVTAQRRSLTLRRNEADRAYKANQSAIVDLRLISSSADVSDLARVAMAKQAERDTLDTQIATLDSGTDGVPALLSKLADLDPVTLAAFIRENYLSRMPEVFSAELLDVQEKRWLLESMIERITPVWEGRSRTGHRWGASVKLKAGLLAGAVASVVAPASSELRLNRSYHSDDHGTFPTTRVNGDSP